MYALNADGLLKNKAYLPFFARKNREYDTASYLGCLPIYAKIPPSTYKICPFTKLEASLARNTAGPAKSSGLPQRAAGVFAIIKLSKG